MPGTLKQSQTAQPILIGPVILASDHISAATGKTLTVTISKNGAAFASPAGAVTEIGSGWYKIAGNATDTGTLGPLAIHVTEASIDPYDDKYDVVAYDLQDAVRLGLTALPNAVAGANGGLPTGNASGQVVVSSTASGAIAAASFASNALDAVWSTATRLLTAGTNIVLAKGTGVTGFNDIAATSIVSSGAITTSGGAVSTVTTLTNAPPDSSGVTTLLSRLPAAFFAGITSLAQWLGAIAGKQVGNTTARTEINATGAGSGTYDETTDSNQALRDRGDSAWTTATTVAVTSNIKKNQALSGFTFVMIDSSDHVTGKTGLTVTATRSLDGAAFASCANAVSEISAGAYKIDLAAADLNGNSVLLKFSATGADTRFVEVVTQP